MYQRHVHEAAANGHLDIVRYLHRLGTDIESRDDEDRRPLSLAAQVTDYCCTGRTDWMRDIGGKCSMCMRIVINKCVGQLFRDRGRVKQI